MTEGPGQAVAEKSRAFRERARLEADRYGPDPWIFVRELLQNSRDAGANAVAFTVGERPASDGSGKVVEWVACQDDGEGMTFEHARRYLFALYASSKEDRKNQAGKFGVGFWSILRFDPQSIIIRSQPREGAPWAVRLDGSLERAEHVEPPQRPGTEILLERPRGDGRLEHRIYDAVWQSARYLHRRDASEQPLPITINGRAANAEFALEAPSASFRRRSVRGVVGLGRAPRVELFCRGLRVRSAACLEDLVAPAGRHTARIRVQFPELPAGLAPQALLESDALEVLLSRSDARDGRALARLVKLAQRELERLVERQLAFARPSPWYRRIVERAQSRMRESLAWRTLAGSVVGAVAALVISLWLWGDEVTDATPEVEPAQPLVVAGGGPEAAPNETYEDLGRRYRGPRIDVLGEGADEPIRLRYRPEGDRLHFAALATARLTDDGAPDHEEVARIAGPYRGARCERGCVEVSVDMRGLGAVRLPVPTGHRVVTGSLRLDGRAAPLHATDEGHPAVDLGQRGRGHVRYQTVEAADPEPAPKPETVARMPEWLEQRAKNLRHLAVNERVGQLLVFVRSRVQYDRSEEMAQRHAEAVARNQSFIERTLELGKGDCDVQNGLLVALLQAADVPARLAVGLLGVDGKVLPWLHAWVEYRDERGHWHIADASERSPQAVAVASSTQPSQGGRQGVVAGAGDGKAEPRAGEDDREGLAAAGASEPTEATPLEAAGDPPLSAAPAIAPESAGPILEVIEPPATDPSLPRWAWPSLALVLLVGATASLVGGRTRRAFKLDDSADLSRLLQGALQQPGAFGAMSALLYRPLVPLVGDAAISLQRARELAAKGKLYRTHGRPPLAMRASRAGSAVLDTQSPEGQTVADALGAIDLDRWDAQLSSSTTTPLLDDVNRLLRRRREGWSLRAATDVSGRISALDLDTLRARVPGLHGSRVVLVDATCPWLMEAEAHYAQAPRTAAFTVLDQVADQLDLPEDRRATLLSEGARAALLESFPANRVP